MSKVSRRRSASCSDAVLRRSTFLAHAESTCTNPICRECTLEQQPMLQGLALFESRCVQACLSNGEKLDGDKVWERWNELLESKADDDAGRELALDSSLKKLYSMRDVCVQTDYWTLERSVELHSKGRASPLATEMSKYVRRMLPSSYYPVCSTMGRVKMHGVVLYLWKRVDAYECCVAAELDIIWDDFPGVVGFTPKIYGYDPCCDVMAMEYVRGTTLRSVLETISNKDMLLLLEVLHSLLAYLWSKHGFLHGDLHSGNIMLRPCEEGEQVPILSTSGDVERLVTLPYKPVLVDFGCSITKACSRWDVACSPLATTEIDNMRLYNDLYYKGSRCPLVVEIAERLSRTMRFVNSRSYYAPLCYGIKELEHESILRRCRELLTLEQQR